MILMNESDTVYFIKINELGIFIFSKDIEFDLISNEQYLVCKNGKYESVTDYIPLQFVEKIGGNFLNKKSLKFESKMEFVR